MLIRCLKGMAHFDCNLEFIIHDFGSTDAATRNLLDQLESQGIRVYRCAAIHSPDQLDRASQTVEHFFAHCRSMPSHYIVTDCDIDMSIARADVIGIYTGLLDQCEEVQCVGPMLRIFDIPPSYPLYNRVMNRHIRQFWSHSPTWMAVDKEKVAVQRCLIDTTFALHRAGEKFTRLKTALRVYEPYEARHLDWYLTSISTENQYSSTSSSAISHWSNYAHFLDHRHDALAYTEYIRVVDSGGGALREITEKVIQTNSRL